MENARTQLLRWTDCLLDAGQSPGAQWRATQDWCDWALRFLGIDEEAASRSTDSFFADTSLVTGKAISPLGAARCVREYRRTAVFLQAMDAALKEAFARFPGETIHVMEAGCGPLAPLVLPFALRYPPGRVVFTLLDLHPVALEGTRRLAEVLGVSGSIKAYLTADATIVRFPEADRPHIIACEVLLRALTKEPQVAATLNLAPQVRPGGFFLPGKIDVRIGLFDAALHSRAMQTTAENESISPSTFIRELGLVFSLDATDLAVPQSPEPSRVPAQTVTIPPHDAARESLEFFTHIKVWETHVIGDFESSLNLPERVVYPKEWAVSGGRAEFFYEISDTPGLRLREQATVLV